MLLSQKYVSFINTRFLNIMFQNTNGKDSVKNYNNLYLRLAFSVDEIFSVFFKPCVEIAVCPPYVRFIAVCAC